MSAPRRWAVTPLVSLVAALGLGFTPSMRGARVVPHELVPFAPGDKQPEPIRASPKPTRPSPPSAALPDAIDYDGERIDAPDAEAAPRDGEPILRAADRPAPATAPPTVDSRLQPSEPEPRVEPAGPATSGPSSGAPRPPSAERPPDPSRADRFHPDGDTSADPVLRYASVFRPSVAPFKRFDVQDRVEADFSLSVSDRRAHPLPLGGEPRPGHDRFYGSVVVDAGDGALVPLPSVAPDSAYLRAETAPPRALRFLRDGAGNDYVRIQGEGVVRLNFLTEAPRTYFGGALPEARFDEVPRGARPRLPAEILRVARAVLNRIGVEPDGTVALALSRLVGHFRAYEAEERRLDARGAELFVALATGKKGACRHRAYAFTILAQALGLPARYVANEAHAFAEAWLPRVGWRRLDLGGVSPELRVYGREGRKPHQPGFDPFARPDPYRAFVRDLGLTPAKREPGPTDLAPAPGTLPSSPPPLVEPAVPEPSSSASAVADGGAPAAEPPQPSTSPSSSAPAGPVPVTLEVFVASREALRGDVLSLAGRAQSGKSPAPGVRIDVTLVAVDGADRRRLGSLFADERGAFSARLPLPAELSPGRYELVVESAADERHRAARATTP